MLSLRSLISVVAALILSGPAQAIESAEQQFAKLAGLSPTDFKSWLGQSIELEVDLAASPAFSVDVAAGRAQVRYRMAFNQVAEGWNWRPLADLAVDDYYQYKFLPLQSVDMERAAYASEDKIGVIQQMQVHWRYDYFLAFDNLYDFYSRRVDDDAGFSADLPASVTGHLALRVKADLIEPMISESTTFWKATYSKPVDFTLKKRYLMGHLQELSFVDADSGKTLCRILPGQDHCSAH